LPKLAKWDGSFMTKLSPALRDSTDVEIEPRERRQPADEAPGQEGSEQVGVTDLGLRDYLATFKRAGRAAVEHQVTDAAAAIAYYTFLAIPALLLISVGIFSIFAGPSAVDRIIEKLGSVVPAEAVALLETALRRTTEEGGGLTMILVGGAVAIWTASGAANAVMRALNRVHDTDESRNFVHQRLVGLAMVLVSVVAFALVFGLLILGPTLSTWIGDLVGAEEAVHWGWLLGQWPILVGGLLIVFGSMLFLGPDTEHRRWRFLSVGAALAVALWLIASGGFSIYLAFFGSYNKTWGSLAAVIIMLTWLWLSSLALLFAAEFDAQVERTRTGSKEAKP
jgi:membrane protein